MSFEFATAARIVFGPGKLRDAVPIAQSFGQRVLLVAGRTTSRARPLIEMLTSGGLTVFTFSVASEPTFDVVRQGLASARKEKCDMVVGLGGGSVLDTAKAIAMLLSNGGDPMDYAEVIGGGWPVAQPSAPLIAIPTTSGTGSEVTRNAVLESPEHRIKVSLRSHLMLPRVALVDPELTYDLSPEITASTGMDALSQLIEPFVSNRANPATDSVCREGIRRAGSSLRRAYENGRDMTARSDMALASLFSGMALANAGLGAVHGFAAPIGGLFHAPHGAICARLLSPVMAVNAQALKKRMPDSEPLRRYDDVAQMLLGRPTAAIDDGVVWASEAANAMKIPQLRSYGVKPTDFDTLIEKSLTTSSMKGNPIALTPIELRQILEQAL